MSESLGEDPILKVIQSQAGRGDFRVTDHAREEMEIEDITITGSTILIIVTVYEPVPPKWVTPTQRRNN